MLRTGDARITDDARPPMHVYIYIYFKMPPSPDATRHQSKGRTHAPIQPLPQILFLFHSKNPPHYSRPISISENSVKILCIAWGLNYVWDHVNDDNYDTNLSNKRSTYYLHQKKIGGSAIFLKILKKYINVFAERVKAGSFINFALTVAVISIEKITYYL